MNTKKISIIKIILNLLIGQDLTNLIIKYLKKDNIRITLKFDTEQYNCKYY